MAEDSINERVSRLVDCLMDGKFPAASVAYTGLVASLNTEVNPGKHVRYAQNQLYAIRGDLEEGPDSSKIERMATHYADSLRDPAFQGRKDPQRDWYLRKGIPLRRAA